LQLPVAEALAALCRETRVPLIINDDVDLALVVGADGVHLGQKDLPVAAVRRIVPEQWLVGASTNNVDEARQAVADGASYVSVGNLFGTTSKVDTRPATLEMLQAVKSAVRVPVCAIGGINAASIRSVVDTGADMAAVISAIMLADDPRQAAQEMATAFEGGR
jgi:thiamine-phosphate diphosphorylase